MIEYLNHKLVYLGHDFNLKLNHYECETCEIYAWLNRDNKFYGWAMEEIELSCDEVLIKKLLE